MVVLFDLLQPQGWRLGLIRLEDVALGVGVSLVVAVLLWPRGARAHLRSALAALYRADAACLDAAFGYLLGRRSQGEVDATRQAAAGPTAIALATAWFWDMEIARLGRELAQPLAAVAAAAQSPWWR